MEKSKTIFPEECCEFKDLSFREVVKAYQTNQTIVGFVESMSYQNSAVYVRLSNDLIAVMPFEEATIYPHTFPKQNPNCLIPLQIHILNKKKICVKVKSIEEGNIILSRKENMLETYEFIQGETFLPFIVKTTKSKIVFGEVGGGILAKINISALCKARIESTTEMCQKGDMFFVKVINFDDFKRVNVSLKDTFPKYDPADYKPGTVITGVVNHYVNDTSTGCFINVSHQVSGILDFEPFQPVLKYGDKIECIIKRATPNGLHLKFSKFL